MKAIVNTKLIMVDGIIWDGAITYENGRIVEVGKRSEVNIPEGCEIIDAKGQYTAPGLIDIHNPGGPDRLFWEDPAACCKFFLQHGETTVLPTFYSSLTAEKIIEGYQKLREVEKTPVGSVIGGLYMEGPYMGAFGSNQKYILWCDGILKEEYEPLVHAMKGFARIWAIDPARENITEFSGKLRGKEKFIRVQCTDAQGRKAYTNPIYME